MSALCIARKRCLAPFSHSDPCHTGSRCGEVVAKNGLECRRQGLARLLFRGSGARFCPKCPVWAWNRADCRPSSAQNCREILHSRPFLTTTCCRCAGRRGSAIREVLAKVPLSFVAAAGCSVCEVVVHRRGAVRGVLRSRGAGARAGRLACKAPALRRPRSQGAGARAGRFFAPNARRASLHCKKQGVHAV